METIKPDVDTTKYVYFNDYTIFYYSASSNPWEAAYINCFKTCGVEQPTHVGTIIFTYFGATKPADQVNRIEAGLFKLYFDLGRFNDVVEMLRYAVRDNCDKGLQSMFMSYNIPKNIWAIGNNLHPSIGAQYQV